MNEDNQILVSVIIPFHNSEDTILECLKSLENSAYNKVLFEVILIDSESSDKSIEIIDTFSQTSAMQITGYKLEDKRGPASARNLGIDVSKGQIVAFIHSDTVVDQNWLLKVHEYTINQEFGLVGGNILSTEVLIFPWKTAPAGHKRNSANLAIRKESLNTIRYDEAFKQSQGEDANFIQRLEKSGLEYNFFEDMYVTNHPISVGISGVISKAKKHKYDNLLFKRDKERALESMHMMFKPVTVFNISPIFLLFLAILFSTFILSVTVGFNVFPILFFIWLVSTFLLLFPPFFDFFITYKPEGHGAVGVLSRIKTVFYTYIFIPFMLFARMKGSIKYKKLLL